MRCRLLLFLAIVLAAPARALEPVRVAEGVYAFVGEAGDIGPANRGRIGNSGFIVGPTGIAVVDAGVSHAHGLALVAAIRRISDKPIERVILTHAVQEFIYGATAFVAEGATLVTHEKSAGLMRARCEHCLENLRQILGEAAMAGTRLLIPAEQVAGSTSYVIGGRRIDLLYPGWASTPGDLMVLDVATRVLFAGGVVTNGRIPELRDGDFPRWIATLDDLPALELHRIVPGYGPPIEPAAARHTRDYLLDLDRSVRALYDANASLMEAVDAAGLPAYEPWSGYEIVHRKNAQLRYLQFEQEELNRP